MWGFIIKKLICCKNIFEYFISATYEAPKTRGACATYVSDVPNFHERCQSPPSNGPGFDCKLHCSNDPNCKGYVKKEPNGTCDIATTSPCNYTTSLSTVNYTSFTKDEDSIKNYGPLLADKSFQEIDYRGCFIKEEGNLYHSK